MVQHLAGDADAEIAHVGEIGQPQPARRVLLPEDDVPIDAMQRPPGADAPLQGTPDAGADLGMTAADLIEDGDRPQAGSALEQRHHLAVPNLAQRIRPPPAARCLFLRREAEISLEAVARGGREPGPGSGNGWCLGVAETHVQPHLAIGDVAAGQGAVPHL
jgi:hypothetical protein